MAGRDAAGVVDYARHRPEETLLYQLVEEHYPTFAGLREAQGRPLPAYVQLVALVRAGAKFIDGPLQDKAPNRPDQPRGRRCLTMNPTQNIMQISPAGANICRLVIWSNTKIPS